MARRKNKVHFRSRFKCLRSQEIHWLEKTFKMDEQTVFASSVRWAQTGDSGKMNKPRQIERGFMSTSTAFGKSIVCKQNKRTSIYPRNSLSPKKRNLDRHERHIEVYNGKNNLENVANGYSSIEKCFVIKVYCFWTYNFHTDRKGQRTKENVIAKHTAQNFDPKPCLANCLDSFLKQKNPSAHIINSLHRKSRMLKVQAHNRLF